MKIIRCLIALFAICSHSFRSLKKEYYAPICIDNMLLKAPMMGRDLHMSVTAAVAYALDRYSDPDRRFKTILFEIPLLLVGYQIVGIHHEVGGHAARVWEFGGKVESIDIGLLLSSVTPERKSLQSVIVSYGADLQTKTNAVKGIFSVFGFDVDVDDLLQRSKDFLKDMLTRFNGTLDAGQAKGFDEFFKNNASGMLDNLVQFAWQLKGYGAHMHETILISLAGNQASYAMSQHIVDDLFRKEQPMDPFTSMVYIYASGNEVFYAWVLSRKLDGHDLVSYENEANLVYSNCFDPSSDKLLTKENIRKNQILSLLDPITALSFYSMFTGRNVKIPMIGNDEWGCLPFARSVLTPYGILEKKFGFYCRTPHTPLKFSVSFGSRRGLNSVDITDPKIASLVEFFRDHVKEAPKGAFSAGLGMLLPGESAPKATSWMFEMTVYKLYATDKLRIGGEFAVWKQPELFTARPLLSGSKNGGMGFIDATYAFSKGVDGIIKIGYKTEGFVQGLPIKKTFIARAGIGIKF